MSQVFGFDKRESDNVCDALTDRCCGADDVVSVVGRECNRGVRTGHLVIKQSCKISIKIF